jgi:uncharacterized protein (DUF2267 family)
MKDEALISAIRNNSDLEQDDEAEEAAYATLTVLGLCLAAGEPLEPSRQFSLDEFYDRVGEIEGTGRDAARRHARAVMAGVRATVSRFEWDNMVSQLPEDYADLLIADAGSVEAAAEPVH